MHKQEMQNYRKVALHGQIPRNEKQHFMYRDMESPLYCNRKVYCYCEMSITTSCCARYFVNELPSRLLLPHNHDNDKCHSLFAFGYLVNLFLLNN